MKEFEKEPYMSEANKPEFGVVKILSIDLEDNEYLSVLGQMNEGTPSDDWTGGISLESRISSGELSEGEISSNLKNLPKYFVQIGSNSPKRCGDGRSRVLDQESDDKTDNLVDGLGAQSFGGSVSDAIALRLKHGFVPGSTLLGDLEAVSRNHKSKFALGGHTDDHAHGDATGCGAIDGQVRKNEILCDESKNKTIKEVLENVYSKTGLEFNQQLFENATRNAKTILNNSKSYFANKQKALETITDNTPNGVEVLSGSHGEISLTINLRNGTTFDKNGYNKLTNGKIQNFNIDAWMILEEYGEDAMYVLIDNVATALDLTDGSIIVIIHS